MATTFAGLAGADLQGLVALLDVDNAFAAELAVALTVAVTALFGTQALSERAFRLLRWIANRPEPPAPEGPRYNGTRGYG